MPAKKLPMRLVREILRLRHGGLSQRNIARSLSIGLGTVCECLAQATKAGLVAPTRRVRRRAARGPADGPSRRRPVAAPAA